MVGALDVTVRARVARTLLHASTAVRITPGNQDVVARGHHAGLAGISVEIRQPRSVADPIVKGVGIRQRRRVRDIERVAPGDTVIGGSPDEDVIGRVRAPIESPRSVRGTGRLYPDDHQGAVSQPDEPRLVGDHDIGGGEPHRVR